MPSVTIGIDGRAIGRIAGQVGGDEVAPNTMTPLPVRLSAGRHRLTLTRGAAGLAPGDGGSANLTSIFLAPAGTGEQQRIQTKPPKKWRSLCGHHYVWIEAVPRILR